ncbi:MAG: hypothetical protein H6983_14735 [Ectothiorhodospiraceae bacterium]|nr:hypothetical protein [Chromatiales bacterium]MCP5155423.1 hypothetical protein [Ectothiorhodospiraceae bacterium]
MSQPESEMEPDWDTPLTVTLTPEEIIHTLFASAETVHTGWDSCIETKLILWDVSTVGEHGDNHCRLVEQEYVEEDSPDITWRDWAVELKIDETYITAHWRADDRASPSEWDWCADQAESAFGSACLLMGKRVRKGLVVEDAPRSRRAPRTRH